MSKINIDIVVHLKTLLKKKKFQRETSAIFFHSKLFECQKMKTDLS